MPRRRDAEQAHREEEREGRPVAEGVRLRRVQLPHLCLHSVHLSVVGFCGCGGQPED